MRLAWVQSLLCSWGCMSIVRLVTTMYPGWVEIWECLVDIFARREYVLVTYAALSTQHETRGHHLGDKWWCMHVYIVFLCRYANHDCISYICWNWLWGGVWLPPTIRMPFILGKLFFWWGTYRTDICHDFTYACAWIRWILKTIQSMQVQTERNLKLIQNKKIVSWNVAQLQLALIS
jgi:hypothetical protein